MDIPESLIRWLRAARHVVAFTGAGVSAESGIPTFRDKQTGLWENHRPEDMATPDGFRRNPSLVWDWYAMRRERVLGAAPNPGHLALAELEKHVPQVTVATQNTDDLHERAGSRAIHHLHGSLMRLKCFGCNRTAAWEEGLAQRASPPKCPSCGDWLRPATVMFHESLPEHDWSMAMDAAENCDMMLVIGTSGLVYPAAELPSIARKAGAALVQVNPDASGKGPEFDYRLQGKSGEILPKLVRSAFGGNEGTR